MIQPFNPEQKHMLHELDGPLSSGRLCASAVLIAFLIAATTFLVLMLR